MIKPLHQFINYFTTVVIAQETQICIESSNKMVNRSRSSVAMRKLSENVYSNLSEENSTLRTKNSELAKGLNDYKQKYAQLFKDSMTIRSKLFEVESHNMKLTEAMRRIESYGRLGLTKLVSFTDDVTHILQETAQITYVPKTSTQMGEINGQSNKGDGRMHAVKPMVSGHTIVRPTITLQRVTTEQLEQLRNGIITYDDVNARGNNNSRALQNEYADLSTSDRSSPLSDEANDNNAEEEEEEVDDDNNVNEQSEAQLLDDRLSTLREESNENLSQINNSRSANDTSNSQRSASFQETTVNLIGDPVVKLHSLSTQQITNLTRTVFPSSRNGNNSPELINNPRVMLRQLSSNVLRNVPASSLNKENANGRDLSSARFLQVPAHKNNFKLRSQKTTDTEVLSYEMLHDVTNNTSIFNDTTAENSFTKFGENRNNDDDELEETLDVSTTVNVSFGPSRLSDNLEDFENYTHSNAVDNVTERQDVFTKLNNNKNQCTSEDNVNIKVRNSRGTFASCCSKSFKSHKFEGGTTESTQLERKELSANTNSYDPLEGPSTLLDNTSFEERFTFLHRLKSPFENTSTPYTPTMVTFRRKRVIPLLSPQLLEPTMFKKSNAQDESSPVSSSKVGKRRKKVLNDFPRRIDASSIDIKSENLSLSQFTNCSVNIRKLPQSLVAEKFENTSSSEVPTKENLPDRTSLKRKSLPSKKKKLEEKKKLKSAPSPVKFSPRRRRTRKAPGTFKEPSLNKKLRRSK